MKFTADRRALLAAVQAAKAATDARSTMPLLSHVLLSVAGKRLTVTGTDLNVSTTTTVAVTGATDGTIAAPVHGAGDLAGLLALLPGETVTCSVSEGAVLAVVDAKRRTDLACMRAADFPRVDSTIPDGAVTVDAQTFRDALQRTVIAACKDETRFHLNGVNVESTKGVTTMVATDSHRMHVTEVALAFPAGSRIIPSAAVYRIAALLADATECAVFFDAKRVVVGVGDSIVSAKLIDAQFPPWRQVMPSHTARTVVNRAELLAAVKRCSVMTRAGGDAVKLSIDGGTLSLDGSSTERGRHSDEVVCETTNQGSMVTIGVNAAYLLAALDIFDTDSVTLGYGGELAPIRITGADESTVAVVMPMRV